MSDSVTPAEVLAELCTNMQLDPTSLCFETSKIDSDSLIRQGKTLSRDSKFGNELATAIVARDNFRQLAEKNASERDQANKERDFADKLRRRAYIDHIEACKDRDVAVSKNERLEAELAALKHKFDIVTEQFKAVCEANIALSNAYEKEKKLNDESLGRFEKQLEQKVEQDLEPEL